MDRYSVLTVDTPAGRHVLKVGRQIEGDGPLKMAAEWVRDFVWNPSPASGDPIISLASAVAKDLREHGYKVTVRHPPHEELPPGAVH